MGPRFRILLAGGALVLLVVALVLISDRPVPGSRAAPPPTGAGASATSPAPPSSGFDGALLPGAAHAPDFTLTDQRGQRVSLRDYRRRVTILSFLSTTCSPTCPLVAQQVRGALDELGRPVPTVIVSAGPVADTPARVRRFLLEAALAGRVEYLTGTLAELQPIWRAYGVVPSELGAAESAHPAFVLLLDRSGEKRDLFQAEQLTPDGLTHDVRRLQGGA